MKLYLDNCCYNRPFDDQTQPRIHLESEAVLIILRRSQQGKYFIIGSTVLELEMARMTDPVKRMKVRELYMLTEFSIPYSDRIHQRAGEIMALSKIRTFDSLHIAAAEEAGADFFLTTDDHLEKMARRLQLGVKIMNPLMFLEEVM